MYQLQTIKTTLRYVKSFAKLKTHWLDIKGWSNEKIEQCSKSKSRATSIMFGLSFLFTDCPCLYQSISNTLIILFPYEMLIYISCMRFGTILVDPEIDYNNSNRFSISLINRHIYLV